jgi:hypothetical protein
MQPTSRLHTHQAAAAAVQTPPPPHLYCTRPGRTPPRPCPLRPLTFRSLAVLLARVIALLGLGRIEPLTWQVARMWMPVNLIFVAMLATNFYALEKVVRAARGCSCVCICAFVGGGRVRV